MTSNELDQTIKTRKSCRKFSDKMPDWEEIIEAIDMARYAPFAGNTNALKIILVSDEEKIAKMAAATQQDFCGNVHFAVVFCTDKKQLVNLYGQKPAEKYARQQAGAAIQNFLLKLEELDLATCWIGYFVERMVRQELRIPDSVDIEAIFPIGYEAKTTGPSGQAKQRKKTTMDALLYFDVWKQSQMKTPKHLDV